MPNMKDVAKLSGVSIKTVSRVLNNEPHVQEILRERVRKAVKELNYIPSRSARALRGRKSYNITLICHSGNSAYVNSIQFGAIIACQSLGYQLSVVLLEGLADKSLSDIKTDIRKFTEIHQPDGILLLSLYAAHKRIAQALDELEIPTVRVGPITDKVNGIIVEIDDFRASMELTQHLLDLGHKRIGFIRGKEDQAATEVRYKGYCFALEAEGIAVDPELVLRGQFDFKSGLEGGDAFLSMESPPTAIFASNDDMAAGVVTAAMKRNLKVPNDLSVVGFDDSDVAVRMWPPLTTVSQPLQMLGEVAITNLVEGFKNDSDKPKKKIVLDHELIIRDTTRKLQG